MNKWLKLGVAMLPLMASPVAYANEDADPWEGFNRAIFAFNDTLDKYLLKSVATGYDKVTPTVVKTGVGNFFNNLGEVTTIVNDLLQGKFAQAGLDSTRFLVNTTVGFVGLVDVGSRIGLERHDEDFGQTFGYWGMGPGPYLMLPLLGPSTVRDTVGRVPDYYLSVYDTIDEESTTYALRGLDIVDTRARLLEVEKMVAGDRYTFFREAYLQRREFLVRDGAMDDAFLEEDDALFEDDFEDDAEDADDTGDSDPEFE